MELNIMKKMIYLLLTISLLLPGLFAEPFNEELTAEERAVLDKGQVLIKNIKYDKYISLNRGISELGDNIISEIEDLNPKYLAEVIQYKPYKGNEDLPQRLEAVLNNVSDYAGIPYYSERNEQYYPLYDSAEIKSTRQIKNGKEMDVDLMMMPFGLVQEKISLLKDNDSVSYVAVSQNKLVYSGITCVGPEKMKMCIFLFRDGDKWVLYGIGGVNAPRIPFLTGRIQTSFINRIKTFCNFIFEKF